MIGKTKVDGTLIRRICAGCGWAPIAEFSTQCRIVGVDDTGADILEELYRDRCDTCIEEGRKANKLYSSGTPVGPHRKLNSILKKRKAARAAIEKVRAKVEQGKPNSGPE